MGERKYDFTILGVFFLFPLVLRSLVQKWFQSEYFHSGVSFSFSVSSSLLHSLAPIHAHGFFPVRTSHCSGRTGLSRITTGFEIGGFGFLLFGLLAERYIASESIAVSTLNRLLRHTDSVYLSMFLKNFTLQLLLDGLSVEIIGFECIRCRRRVFKKLCIIRSARIRTCDRGICLIDSLQ